MSKNRKIPVLEQIKSPKFRRGATSIILAGLLWELGRAYKLPMLQALPAPSEVIGVFFDLIFAASYWGDWGSSFARVLKGFLLQGDLRS